MTIANPSDKVVAKTSADIMGTQTRVGFWLSKSAYKDLRARAMKEDKTVSFLLRKMVQQYLRNQQFPT